MSASRDAFFGFRVTKAFAPLGLAAGERLYCSFAAPRRRFTVVGLDRTCRELPANFGAVLEADLAGCLEQTDGLFMDIFKRMERGEVS